MADFALDQPRHGHAQARERENDRDCGQHKDDDQYQVIFGPFAGHGRRTTPDDTRFQRPGVLSGRLGTREP
jgi:hypothetical protein